MSSKITQRFSSLVSTERFLMLKSLRAKVFQRPPPPEPKQTDSPATQRNIRTGAKILLKRPRALELLQWNPPSIDFVKVAKLDPTLSELGLKDVRLEELKQREDRLKAKGKRIFVSVVDGVTKPAAKVEPTKGKKRK